MWIAFVAFLLAVLGGSLYLFNKGNEFTDITGGWTSQAWSYNTATDVGGSPGASNNGTSLVATLANLYASALSGVVRPQNMLDLTYVSSLVVHLRGTLGACDTANGGFVEIWLFTRQSTSGNWNTGYTAIVQLIRHTAGGAYSFDSNFTIGVAALTGNHYFCIGYRWKKQNGASTIYTDSVEKVMLPFGYWTQLLLHMNGENGETTFVDSSVSNRAVTNVGGAQKTTGNKKFGTAALLITGPGQGLTVPSHADFALGSRDYTIDAWIYISAIVSETLFFKSEVNGGIQIGFNGTTAWGIAANQVAWKLTTTTFPSINAWHHIAVTRSAGTTRIFLDGVVVASATDTTSYAQGDCRIGSLNSASTLIIDELRYCVGIARWTGNFTPPTAEHSVD